MSDKVCHENHKCKDCKEYIDDEHEWPCVWSHCPHHPEAECRFIPKEKLGSVKEQLEALIEDAEDGEDEE